MSKLEVLKSELLGKEISFINLDNFMCEQGFYSESDHGVVEQVKQDKNIVYTLITEDDEPDYQIKIDFDITIDNGKGECIEAFDMKITNIEEF